MRSCPLNKRLRAVASFVPRGSVLADIGTDHAYLPVYLAQQGICPRTFACDVKDGPLQKAKDTISLYHCEEKVVPLLSDGLRELSPSQVDTIAIAGMGGELISRIIEDAPWCREKTLILQPMTAADKLRRSLYRQGFSILREKAVRDSGKLYTVMLVGYTGESKEIDEVFALLGKLSHEDGEEAVAYRRLQRERVEKKARGLAESGQQEESGRWFRVAMEIEKAGKSAQNAVLMGQVRDALEQLAPRALAESWDNPGFLVGDLEAPVKRVLVALDVTPAVIEEAVRLNATLILTHHPVIFHAAKQVRADGLPWKLIRNGLSALCAHTNLDAAQGGVNDTLAQTLGLTGLMPFAQGENAAMGRIGCLEREMEPEEFAAFVKERLGSPTCLCGFSVCPVKRVAVVSGSGGDFVEEAAKAGAHVLLTGEAGHHEFLLARQMGITLIAAGHYETERVVLPVLREKLGEMLPQVEFILSKEDDSPVRAI